MDLSLSGVPFNLVDTDAFADALVEYYENPDRLAHDGSRAREWVGTELPWDHVARTWLDLFDERVERL